MRKGAACPESEKTWWEEKENEGKGNIANDYI